jgi:hypothetical protein
MTSRSKTAKTREAVLTKGRGIVRSTKKSFIVQPCGCPETLPLGQHDPNVCDNSSQRKCGCGYPWGQCRKCEANSMAKLAGGN